MNLPRLAWMLSSALVLSSCALKRDSDSGAPFTIQLVKSAETPSRDLVSILGISSSPATPPSTIDSFNCFAVNVTGPGIVPGASDQHDCDMSADYAARGFGRTSDSVTYGTPIQLTIPSGSGRTIDVVGLIKDGNGQTCDGAGTGINQSSGDSIGMTYGYLLGRVQKDILSSETVPVNISYTGQAPILACRDDNPSVTPQGDSNGSYIYRSPVSGYNCTSSTSSAPVSIATSLRLTDYSGIVNGGDNSYTKTGCVATSGHGAIAYMAFDVSGAGDLSQYAKFSIGLAVNAGLATGLSNTACSSPTGSSPQTLTASTSMITFDVWDPVNTAWVSQYVWSPNGAAAVFGGTYTLTDPSHYVDPSLSGKQIWARVVSGTDSSACSFIQFDWLRLQLYKT